MTPSQRSVCLLLGHPRSGTTFLHRFILENYLGLAGKTLEDMVFSSCGPRFLRAAKSIARILPLSWVYPPAIHLTGMKCREADDIAFAIHCKAGYLFWLYKRCRTRERFDPDEFYDWVAERKEDVLACWEHLYHQELYSAVGTNILSKSFIMLFYLEESLARYPDAKVILLTRTPMDVIPSTISLVNLVTRRFFPFRRLNQTEIANIYQTISLYYRKMSSVLANPAIANRCLHLSYADLTTQFGRTCKRISNYLGYGSWDEAAVFAQSARQAQWASAHRYNVGDFGLSEERIVQEVPFA